MTDNIVKETKEELMNAPYDTPISIINLKRQGQNNRFSRTGTTPRQTSRQVNGADRIGRLSESSYTSQLIWMCAARKYSSGQV